MQIDRGCYSFSPKGILEIFAFQHAPRPFNNGPILSLRNPILLGSVVCRVLLEYPIFLALQNILDPFDVNPPPLSVRKKLKEKPL